MRPLIDPVINTGPLGVFCSNLSTPVTPLSLPGTRSTTAAVGLDIVKYGLGWNPYDGPEGLGNVGK